MVRGAAAAKVPEIFSLPATGWGTYLEPVQPVLRARRRRPRFRQVPNKSLWGLGWVVAESALLCGALLIGGAELLQREREATFSGVPRVFTGVSTGQEPIAGLDGTTLLAQLRARSSAWLDAPMRLESKGRVFRTTPRHLGARHEPEYAVQEALAWGRGSSLSTRVRQRLWARSHGVDIPLRAQIDPSKARSVLASLAPKLHREAAPGRADLAARRFLAPTPARGLLVEETLPRVALAMAKGETQVELSTYSLIPPERAKQIQEFPDISKVVGEYTLEVDSSCKGESERKENRSLAIQALQGSVLEPQGRLSLWTTIQEPSMSRGFAPAQACPSNAMPMRRDAGLSELASAIFAASFFAGLDLVHTSLPDDRIAGAPLGLDASLAWPTQDLVVANPHEFAVVLSVKERGDKIFVQWLGASRPFRIAFERDIVDTQRFETTTRPDPQALLGSKTTIRPGRAGYTFERRRVWTMTDNTGRTDIDHLKYAPRSAIVAVGENPLGPPPPDKSGEPSQLPVDPKIRIFQ